MTPASWLLDNADLLPFHGRALDVACGRGRHAMWLGARGLETLGVDRNEEAVAFVNDEARRLGVPVRAEVRDIEAPGVSLGHNHYDVIVVVHYLHRPLFPALIDALRPDGLLIYETFTREQAKRGKPSSPAFLLETGELRRLVQPLTILREREGVFDDRDIAAVVGRKGS